MRTTKTIGTVNGCSPWDAPCPSSFEEVAIWHSHGAVTDNNGDGQDDYDSENFSGYVDTDSDGIADSGDKYVSDGTGLDIYLGTPGGDFSRYSPSDGSVTDLGSCQN